MTGFVDVKLDEKANNAMFYHQTLVDGSNALKLQPILAFKPLIVGPDLKPEDYNSKRAELVDRVHLASRQLNEHYNQIADSNPDFIPYWEQETTFTFALSNLPKIKRKNFFENYQKFFERNGIEERIKLDENMQHFDPFYSSCPKQLTYERLTEEFSFFKEERLNVSVIGGLTSIMFAVLGSAAILTHNHIPSAGISLYVAGLATLVVLDYVDNREHRRELDKIGYRYLKTRASEADKIIPLIKEFS